MRASLLGLMLLGSVPALADEAPRMAPTGCADIAHPRDIILGRNGRWIELTDMQRAFVAGIYVINPTTPAGLPVGDRAALAQIPPDKGGVVFFLDGTLACSPMPVPDAVVDMIRHIGQGDVTHETEGTPN